jgi:antitoxin (DNA-binding transcriptional repressor) of toxin-antitoxin stability system
MKRVVNIHEAKTKLSSLIAAVEAGDEVTIARGGKPVVDLVRHTVPAVDRVPGVLSTDPAWREWRFDPTVFAPMTDEEVEAEGWP